MHSSYNVFSMFVWPSSLGFVPKYIHRSIPIIVINLGSILLLTMSNPEAKNVKIIILNT